MVELDPFFHQINSWSFTKHRVWNRCKRQYYFEYIAPYVKSQPVVDPEKIRWLKNFTSKFVVQGQLIHDIIDKQIQLHIDNKPMNLVEAMNEFSKKVSLYKNIGGETFTEYHNGDKIPDSFYATINENGKTCLQTFFRMWMGYQNQECLRHEEFDHFKIGDVGVTVKVDFVGKMPDGMLVLTDWKTGRDDDENETELQMATYVLWAMQYYRKSPDEIRTELVFLKTGETKPYAFFWEQVSDVQEMIPREFTEMNASYEYPDFSAKPSPRECMSCKFAEVCPDAAIGRK
ncbi:MAG: PD-(D/E)XK nuclease family protein [Methanoregula sp.]|jgi:CRISPR/Cas system-associated exonuclease Cas4 (RecB family)|uniref:RecB family exonuclease n=1 Tax=Methanoregula sp. TaxID=2052170 RepID=UPI0025EC69BB|nr:PD-(D/E)XK nuclease family protein [Methanoregula sp.]MCK9632587.1 PD-(D/E)XK nuclease family protein [Methanoregula sp.]